MALLGRAVVSGRSHIVDGPRHHRNIPIHSVLVATLVSQPSTAHLRSVGTVTGGLPVGLWNPTPAGAALVGLRFSKQSAQ